MTNFTTTGRGPRRAVMRHEGTVIALLTLLACVLPSTTVRAESDQVAADRVGRCGTGPTCSMAGCHAPAVPWSGSVELVLAGPPEEPLPASYIPAQTYDLLLRLMEPDFRCTPPVLNVCGETVTTCAYGFQVTALTCATGGERAGCLVLDPAEPRTRLECDPGPCPDPCDISPTTPLHYLGHGCGVSPTTVIPPQTKEWRFSWTAPPAGRGQVEIEVAAVSADGDATPAGDATWVGRFALDEDTSSGCDLRADSSYNDLVSCPEPLPLTVLWPGFTGTPSVDVDTTDPVFTIYQVECPCTGRLRITRQGTMVHADWQ